MNWFTNLKTRTKLLLGFGIVTMFTLALGIQAIRVVETMKASEDDLYLNIVVSLKKLGDYRANLLTLRMRNVRLVTATGEGMQKALDQVREAEEQVGKDLQDLKANLVGPEEVRELERAQAEWNDYLAMGVLLRKAVTEHRIDDALGMISGAMRQKGMAVEAHYESLIEGHGKEAKATDDAFDVMAVTSRNIVLAILLAAMGVGIGLGFFMARSIANPIAQVVQTIDNADLTSSLASDRKDEIGDLLRAFDKFTGTIRATLTKWQAPRKRWQVRGRRSRPQRKRWRPVPQNKAVR